MHYLLLYDYVSDYLKRRAPLRAEHLNLAWAAHARGELILAGALADPADGAVFLFRADTPKPAADFALADPYIKHGLVKRWQVRPWNTVVGKEAALPIRPDSSE